MDRSLVCLISGKKYIFSKDYFEKKIEEYGGAEQLKKFFVTKKVKSLISFKVANSKEITMIKN
jgi:hypothetical protein